MSSFLRFATLTPENDVAQECLASLVDQQSQQGSGSRVNPVRAIARVSPNAPTTTPLTAPNHRAAEPRYQLDVAFDKGSGLNGTWTIGKPGSKNDANVDLPICSSRSRQLTPAQICEIYIHPRSGLLILRNTNVFHSIIYLQADGDTDVELRNGDEHVLHMTRNHLRIGPLDYVLDISVDNEEAYRVSRDRYEEMGAFGVVRAGVDRQSGDVVACKTIHSRRRDVQFHRNEVDIASSILPNTVGIVSLIETWCEHGQSPPCFQAAFEDIHLLMPYAPRSFRTTAWHDTPLTTRLALFRQVLEGLRNLHAAGIMHRDISPNNLLVFSHQPPVAAICDFGKSKRGTRGNQTGLGPPELIAPEVGSQEGYTNSIDMFSLGLSMLATFKSWEYTGPMSVPDNHTRILRHLANQKSSLPEDLFPLLRSMLAWDPKDRPTAEQALADKIWDQIAVVGPDPETQSSSGDSSEPGLSTTEPRLQRSGGPSPSGSGGTNKRMRRSDAPAPSKSEMDSEEDSKKTTQRPDSSSSGGREKRLRRSDSRALLSPPPLAA